MIAEEVGIGRETAHLIVTQDLGKRKLCYRLVPHTLTPEQMQLRLDACGDLIDMADRDSNFLKTIVTGDGTWCLRYDPEGKRHSIEWRSPGSQKSKKARRHHIKCLHVRGNTETSAATDQVDTPLVRQARRLDSIPRQCPATHCLSDAEFPGQEGSCAPESPALLPRLFLVPKLKSALKGQKFSHISDIQRNVTTQLKAIPKDGYDRSFQDLYSRSQKCITIDGDYFEGQ
ncbi:hypothetical protein AVEN_142710-1 [Araneus ventricosus]|uniref:Mariner Mos1 transposase n=1 Tax=Araneus ventricosus TaxID=182803 RepID=A0A4Y2K3H8_ARAVE|nr:hypothetical protein AVEN_142710-1 [Araneus ventricosus]